MRAPRSAAYFAVWIPRAAASTRCVCSAGMAAEWTTRSMPSGSGAAVAARRLAAAGVVPSALGLRLLAAWRETRAMALDPEVLFFDEPSAGLDPISASLLDDLILELRDSLGATIIVVTHELASIFAIGNNSVYLDPDKKTMTAAGDPKKLLAETRDPELRRFLTRGKG